MKIGKYNFDFSFLDNFNVNVKMIFHNFYVLLNNFWLIIQSSLFSWHSQLKFSSAHKGIELGWKVYIMSIFSFFHMCFSKIWFLLKYLTTFGDFSFLELIEVVFNNVFIRIILFFNSIFSGLFKIFNNMFNLFFTCITLDFSKINGGTLVKIMWSAGTTIAVGVTSAVGEADIPVISGIARSISKGILAPFQIAFKFSIASLKFISDISFKIIINFVNFVSSFADKILTFFFKVFNTFLFLFKNIISFIKKLFSFSIGFVKKTIIFSVSFFKKKATIETQIQKENKIKLYVKSDMTLTDHIIYSIYFLFFALNVFLLLFCFLLNPFKAKDIENNLRLKGFMDADINTPDFNTDAPLKPPTPELDIDAETITKMYEAAIIKERTAEAEKKRAFKQELYNEVERILKDYHEHERKKKDSGSSDKGWSFKMPELPEITPQMIAMGAAAVAAALVSGLTGVPVA